MSTDKRDRPTLQPSSVGQFFNLQSCPMYLQWEYDDEGRAALQSRSWETQKMSPVLANEGDTFEGSQLVALANGDRDFVGVEDDTPSSELTFRETWDDDLDRGTQKVGETLESVAQTEASASDLVVFQPHLAGTIGAYDLAGKGDILVLESTETGVRPTVLEVKSSSEQKVHHRYQATIYATLLEQLASERNIALETPDSGPRTCIVTPDNQIESDLDDLESFDVAPYRSKLTLKLAEGGSFDQTILETDFETTTNRIARRCSGCKYEPLCMTRGVESKGLELLGLQAGTQEALHQLGVHDIEDFAMLFDHPETGSVHWDYEALTPRDAELVQRVRQEADITNLQKRAQIAYRFLVEIDDNYGRDGPDHYPHPLRGTGNALPEDEHGRFDVDWTEWNGPDYPSGSLVRVYPYVQQDHAQNRVTVLSAYVECTLTDESREVTELPGSIPTTVAEKQHEESRLFEEFFQKLANAVTEVAPDWTERGELSNIGLDPDEGFIHLFFYSDSQRDALMEAVRRHPRTKWRRSVRTLLGLREGIDQEMISTLQDDFRNRWALRFPGLGLVQSTAQFQWRGDWFDWRTNAEDGREVPLAEIFETGLFDGTVKYHRNGGTAKLDHSQPAPSWTPTDMRLARWMYPLANREADQFPIEYIWALHGRLDPNTASDPLHVLNYFFRDEVGEDRITESDIELLSQNFAKATHHIERTIETQNKYAKNRFVNKEPLDLADIRDFSFDPRTLDEVCIEYQQLEYHTNRKTTEAYYRQPLGERVDSGASVLFECQSVDEENNRIHGQLLTSDGTVFDPEEHDTLIGGALSVSDNDFMVLTRLSDEGDRPEASRKDSPDSIGTSTTVIVSEVDETTGEIVINAPFTDGWPRWGQYTVRHRGWSTDQEAVGDEWLTYVAVGERYVVDPMFDQVTQNRAYEAIENGGDAQVRRWIRELYEGERQELRIDRWNEDNVEAYVDRMEALHHRPNTQQEKFVRDTSHGIVMLQGPPGTGKTKFSVAPAILGRVHSAMKEGKRFVGAVSAVSHSAVNEALRSIVQLLDTCSPGADHQDVELIRICSSAGQGIDHERVTHIEYNDDDAADELERIYETYLSEQACDDRAIFFGPPVSIRSCLNRMLREVEAAPHDSIEELMREGDAGLFDATVVDEASMMDLPLCFLIGTFVAENGQFMLVGDHRQMQPIQQHEWETEDREPIERHHPFLSALDFLRYLRGEDVDLEYVEREPPQLDSPNETLPIHRLRETHRLPAESAAMHTDLFYSQDGIQLKSVGEEAHMPEYEGPLSNVLDSKRARITLLVHDESASQKSNPIEQALIMELLGDVSVRNVSDSESEPDVVTAGVVVPFRAQRRDVLGQVPREVAVDTVERFQGGERDLMILSMTASERGYISQISEFLLDPNRFNVGASRMKRKLVILASSGVFEESSNDVETFEDQEAWIQFFQSMGGLSSPDETYQLDELVSETVQKQFLADLEGVENHTVKVFSGYPFSVNGSSDA